MVTTLVTRETIRDGLVTLATATGKWQAVYGYVPKDNAVRGQSPFLVILSLGTLQSMESEGKNPAEYSLSVMSHVLMNDKGSWTEANAEDKLDELDKVLRQLIRDNASGSSYCDAFTFLASPSQTDFVMIGGEQYRTEARVIIGHHYSGS